MLAIWVFGCTFGRKWFYALFSISLVDFHNSVREFLPIMITFEILGHLLSNSTVVLHVDNQAVVYVISKNSFMQGPITLATHAMPYGITSNTQHPFPS